MYESYVLNGMWGSARPYSATEPARPLLADIVHTPGTRMPVIPGGIRQWPDGRYDFEDTRISEGDIARVAQLYPVKKAPAVASKAEWAEWVAPAPAPAPAQAPGK